MNETVLFILLSAGVAAIGVTIWIAARSRAPVSRGGVNTGRPAPPGSPPGRHPVPVHLAQPQAVSLAGRPPMPEFPGSAHHTEDDARGVLLLLQQAYDQLKTRQQKIECELGRIEMLRDEHDAVEVQVSALDIAMKAFSALPDGDCRHPGQEMFASGTNDTSFPNSPAVHEEIRAHDSSR